MSTRSSVAAILICGFTSLLHAQAPPAPPKPGPEHKKLEYFVGKWTVESEIKANKYMPAGKSVSTETCTLGPGGFYTESLAEGQVPTRLAIMAYDSHAKVYTSYYASSVGLVGVGTGTVEGDTWTWMVEDKYAGKAVKGRTTITISSASQYTEKYEMLDANGRYVTIQEGTATKVSNLNS
jgi:ribosomal protein L33